MNYRKVMFSDTDIENIKSTIEENTYLSEYDKEELLNKLEEIKEV